MAVTYLNIVPSEPNPGPIDAFYNQTFLSRSRRLSPLEAEFRREDEQYEAERGLTPDQRLVSRAAKRFQSTFDLAWNKYSRKTLQDGVDGFYDFSIALDKSRDKELTSATGPVKAMLQPILAQLHLDGTKIGLKHWGEQNQALNRHIQLARVERDKANNALADSAQGEDTIWSDALDEIDFGPATADTIYGGKDDDVINEEALDDRVRDQTDSPNRPVDVGTSDRHDNPTDMVPPGKPATPYKVGQLDYWRRPYPGPGYVLKGDVRSIWKYDPVAALALGDVEAKSEPDPFVTEFWDYIDAKFHKNLDTSILGPLFGGATLPGNAIYALNDQQVKDLADRLRKSDKLGLFGKNSNMRQNIAEYLSSALPDQKQTVYNIVDQTLREAGVTFYTEEEWKKSGFYHPALHFEPFMTPERAEARFLNLKKLATYDYLISHRPDGILSGTAGFLAGLAGDPINYIPGTLAFKEFGAGARVGLTTLRGAKAPRDFIRLGEYAGESIPARSASKTFVKSEREQINRIGAETGCHTCGTKEPGTASGNFVPDHQLPSRLNPPGQPQRLYPQCLDCSKKQGMAIIRELQKGR